MAILGPGNGTLQNGVLSNVTSIPAFIAAGTRMIFEQTSAPTNWTKITTGVNNYAIRVVTGTAAPGGTVAFSTVFSTARAVSGSVGQGAGGGTVGQGAGGGTVGQGAGGGTVQGATLATAQIPPHNHSFQNHQAGIQRGSQGPTNTVINNPFTGQSTGNAGSGQAHGHGFQGAQHVHPFSGAQHVHPFSGAQHVHPWSGTANLNVRYVDVIIASKN
jgi:hypothetical protein